MGLLKVTVCISICLAAVLAYILNTPVPDGIQPVIHIKLRIAASKAAGLMTSGLAHFGYERAPTLRKWLKFMYTLLPSKHSYPDVKVTHMKIADVPVTMYTPRNALPRGRAVLYYFGSGWVVFDTEIFASDNKQLAEELNAVVFAVDYRLAPEHPYPAAIDDCGNVTLYVLQHAEEYGIDPSRVAVMGDSAGGNMAAALSIRMRDIKSKVQPKLQVLLYPVTQVLDFDTPSYRANEKDPWLTKKGMIFFVTSYLFGNMAHQYFSQLYISNHTTPAIKKSAAETYMNIRDLPSDDFVKGYQQDFEHGNAELWNQIKYKIMDPSLSPLFAPYLTGLPHAYISTCQYDVLRDDGIFYAKRLEKAGVKTYLNNVQLCFHGWLGNAFFVPMFQEEYLKIIKYIADNL